MEHYVEQMGNPDFCHFRCHLEYFFDFGTFGKSPEALPSSVHTNFSIRIDPRHPEIPIPGPDSGNLHFRKAFG